MAAYSFFYYCLRRNIFSKIDHIKTIIFKKNFHYILSDIMDITFYGSKDDLLVASC